MQHVCFVPPPPDTLFPDPSVFSIPKHHLHLRHSTHQLVPSLSIPTRFNASLPPPPRLMLDLHDLPPRKDTPLPHPSVSITPSIFNTRPISLSLSSASLTHHHHHLLASCWPYTSHHHAQARCRRSHFSSLECCPIKCGSSARATQLSWAVMVSSSSSSGP